jgi:conjugal transfer pilus assembly protein TrbC
MKTTTLLSRAKIMIALLLAGAAHAAAPQLPDDDALAREAAKQAPRSSSAIAKAGRQAGLLRQPVPDVGQPSPLPSLDPAALAKRFESARPQEESDLFILVSFSMPPESIERLAAQAGKAGATLVLRGMVDGSLKRTAEVAAEFVKKHSGAQFQIDPTLFKRFAVKQVPAFVLSARPEDDKTCGKDCDASNTFAGVSGDVTLDYALEYLARRRDGRFSAMAEHRLKLLRGPL